MEICSFNMKHGYLEALVRGLKVGFLTEDQYVLIQNSCETVDDLENFLKETAWGNIMLDTDQKPYSAPLIGMRLKQRLAAEFNYFVDHAVEPLSTFLQYIARERMIDNVLNMIQGVVNKKDYAEMLARSDPLGHFEGLQELCKVDADDLGGDFFRTVLQESPIGGYFETFFAATRALDVSMQLNQSMITYLAETNMDVMRCILKRAWLEDFHEFCRSQGGVTAEVMCKLLEEEADIRALGVVLNMPRNAGDSRSAFPAELQDVKEQLFAGFGQLYPQFVRAVVSDADDDTIRRTVEPFKPLMELFTRGKELSDPHHQHEALRGSSLVSVEDLLFEARVKSCEMGFDQQMQLGVFYAYITLKQQEIANLVWCADMLVLGEKQHLTDVVHIFKPKDGLIRQD